MIKKGLRILKWPRGAASEVQAFLERPAFDPDAEAAAGRVVRAVDREGDRAVLRYARQFDGVSLKSKELRVTDAELAAARRQVGADFKKAVRDVKKRVTAFARAGRRADWSMKTPRGGKLGERFNPLKRVGVYVPGGTAPLASTVLMTVPLAHVAGVPEIVACTPCGEDKHVRPELLYALAETGATEIYRVGGIHAVAMMACGTESVARVLKIVGPGGPYVTAAKRHVYGRVALDLVAGPSEIAILADASADPRLVAADLLSQAEHGSGQEKALLVTTSQRLAERVASEVVRQAETLTRSDTVRVVMREGMMVVVCPSLQVGMELCNRFAPEHFELLVREPARWLKQVKSAGAVFLGKWSPESAGDFAAGPSHVLPTGGTASMFAGLTVDDFRTRTSVIGLTRADLAEMLPAIETFGAVEGLDGHVRSARMRFVDKEKD